MKAYPWCCRHHPVGENKQIQANQLENVLKKPDDLQGEHVLQRRNRKQSQLPLINITAATPVTIAPTCRQSSPTLKMAACQQTLLDPSEFCSSTESEVQRRPSLSSSLTPQRFTLNLAR